MGKIAPSIKFHLRFKEHIPWGGQGGGASTCKNSSI